MKQLWHSVKTKPFLLFTVLLLIKEYLARYVLFNHAGLWTTIFVSLPSILAAAALVELFARKRKIAVYMAVDVVLTSVYFAAIMYHKYFGIVVTYRALQQANQVTEVNASVFNLMHPYFLLIYMDIVVLGILLGFRRDFRIRLRSNLSFNKKIAASLLTVCLAISVSRVYAHKDIVNEIKQAERMGILNYEIYAILKDLEPAERADVSEITQETIDRAKGLTRPEEPVYHGAAQGKNIVVVQLESFQDFLIGLKVDGKEITPNLNKLAGESLYFPNVYQQVGQGNTSDAEFVLNTSFYVPQKGAASDEYADRELPSLPKLMKQNGYEALTFHTNEVTFWNRQELYQALGFDKYYDKPFFGSGDEVAFGESDEVLYRKTVEELKRKNDNGVKIYANVISMSSHHPYHLPPEKKTLKLPAGLDGTLTGNYLQGQHYADFAFGLLVDELKQKGMWDNTVLFVYGDHVGLTMNLLAPEDRKALNGLLGKEYDYDEMLNIPLLIRVPGVEGSEQRQLGGQADFMPTIANLAGIPLQDHVHFGQDLLNQTHNLLPERYYLPTGSFVSDRMVFVPGEEVADGKAVPVAALSSESEAEAAAATADRFKAALQLLKWSDSYVESLPLRQTP